MKTEKYSGTIASAYGKELDAEIKFEGEFTKYESFDEAKAANDLPSNEEQVTIVNNKRKANARQKSMQAALDAAGIVKPTLEDDPQLQLRQIYKALLASGKSEEQSRQVASASLGVEWID